MNIRAASQKLKATILSALILSGSLSSAFAAELTVEARLLWGSNDAKSPDPSHKPVDEETAKKLKAIFTWKHYFEVNRKKAVIPARQMVKVNMSKECDVEITEMEGPKVSLVLYGKGHAVNKTVANLSKGESVVVAGGDKNSTAWFVMITDLEEK